MDRQLVSEALVLVFSSLETQSLQMCAQSQPTEYIHALLIRVAKCILHGLKCQNWMPQRETPSSSPFSAFSFAHCLLKDMAGQEFMPKKLTERQVSFEAGFAHSHIYGTLVSLFFPTLVCQLAIQAACCLCDFRPTHHMLFGKIYKARHMFLLLASVNQHLSQYGCLKCIAAAIFS